MLYCFSKSKNQVVHEQKFKDLLSSTCQVSPERIVSDLGSEILGGLVSIQTEGNIFHCFFFVFYVVKPIVVNFQKNSNMLFLT